MTTKGYYNTEAKRKTHALYNLDWAKKNRNRKLEIDRKSRIKNKSKKKQMDREYYTLNKESILKYKKEWARRNKEKIKEYGKERYKKNREVHSARVLARRKVAISPGELCEVCQIRKAEQRHHKDYTKPLQVSFLCKECHNKIHKEEYYKNI
jgi:hypothetical protein